MNRAIGLLIGKELPLKAFELSALIHLLLLLHQLLVALGSEVVTRKHRGRDDWLPLSRLVIAFGLRCQIERRERRLERTDFHLASDWLPSMDFKFNIVFAFS